MNRLNKEILNIAIPAIITNITVPLLGLIDVSIAGHLGSEVYIDAIAVGAMMFNLLYWNFEFLRMGTSGLTAQAYGSGKLSETQKCLSQSVALALIIASFIIILQRPFQKLALLIIGASPEVQTIASNYFDILVWGAPAVLVTKSIYGWLLGMQDSRSPMIISISVNVINIVASLIAVIWLKVGFIGVAIGSLLAVYCGLIMAIFILLHKHSSALRGIKLNSSLLKAELIRFMSINRDIFLRSLCLLAVTLFFVSAGARSGNTVLAINTLMMHLFILFSYFIDGFAFAGEAIVGKYAGARDIASLTLCVKKLFGWGGIIMLIFTAIYALAPQLIFSIMTDDSTVISLAMQYRWWCVAIPIAGMAAFVWDGIFVGLTSTRSLFLSVFIGALIFFSIWLIMPFPKGNDRLWLAFISYLAARSIVLTIAFLIQQKSLKKQ